MKNINSIFILFVLILSSCNTNNKNNLSKTIDACLPGFVLMVYIGENSAPIFSTLIRTNETDSTYYNRYIGGGREMFLRNDFAIDENWDKNYIKKIMINDVNYNTLKEYIVNNNTKREEVENVDDYSFTCPIKVILSDRCDSIVYIVNKTDTNYFKRLVDLTQTFENENLTKQLIYYKEWQEFDYEELRKKND